MPNANGTLRPEPKVFLTGHSLGGAIAEFVSSQDEEFPGDTFAAPGIAGAIGANAILVVLGDFDCGALGFRATGQYHRAPTCRDNYNLEIVNDAASRFF